MKWIVKKKRNKSCSESTSASSAFVLPALYNEGAVGMLSGTGTSLAII